MHVKAHAVLHQLIKRGFASLPLQQMTLIPSLAKLLALQAGQQLASPGRKAGWAVMTSNWLDFAAQLVEASEAEARRQAAEGSQQAGAAAGGSTGVDAAVAKGMYIVAQLLPLVQCATMDLLQGLGTRPASQGQAEAQQQQQEGPGQTFLPAVQLPAAFQAAWGPQHYSQLSHFQLKGHAITSGSSSTALGPQDILQVVCYAEAAAALADSAQGLLASLKGNYTKVSAAAGVNAGCTSSWQQQLAQLLAACDLPGWLAAVLQAIADAVAQQASQLAEGSAAGRGQGRGGRGRGGRGQQQKQLKQAARQQGERVHNLLELLTHLPNHMVQLGLFASTLVEQLGPAQLGLVSSALAELCGALRAALAALDSAGQGLPLLSHQGLCHFMSEAVEALDAPDLLLSRVQGGQWDRPPLTWADPFGDSPGMGSDEDGLGSEGWDSEDCDSEELVPAGSATAALALKELEAAQQSLLELGAALGSEAAGGGAEGAAAVAGSWQQPGWAVVDEVQLALAAGAPAHCYNPLCTGSGGVKLNRCSSCRVALYCSAACQKQAWKLEHRQACAGASKRVEG